ncbi:MAG: elongation factor 1-beta [Candidatus Aenigmarchaeota archaeon]|nr:elongation factor 1-beta [Candidatus Aenigmarchaeota archaeon]
MGQVALTLNVMPESTDVDIRGLKEKIKAVADVKQIVEKPVAFGLIMLEVLLVFDDKKGASDFEEKIRGIDGVGTVESGDITLI